jgi:hypothetical protein
LVILLTATETIESTGILSMNVSFKAKTGNIRGGNQAKYSTEH